MRCTSCGAEMPEGAHFCSSCGKDQVASHPSQQDAQTPRANVFGPAGWLALLLVFVFAGCLALVGGAGDNDRGKPAASRAKKVKAAGAVHADKPPRLPGWPR